MLLKLLALLLCSTCLAMSASPEDRDRQNSQLFTCIRAGNTACAYAAIRGGASVNARDADAATPLLYTALYSPDTTIMRLLLASGAHVDAMNNAGASALLWATGNLEKVKLLVGNGADVNARSQLGKTALMIAASRDGAGPVVAYLLSHGARTDFQNTLAGALPIPLGGGGNGLDRGQQSSRWRGAWALVTVLCGCQCPREKWQYRSAECHCPAGPSRC